MRCDEVQPNLLDYGEGLLTGPESEEVKAHLAECAECAALLEEETMFSRHLAALPEMQPANDVWALVRAQVKPGRMRSFAWLHNAQPLALLRGAMNVNMRRIAAALALSAAMLVAVYNYNQPQPPVREISRQQTASVAAVKWSDDPVGDHTDAVVEYIDKM